MKNNLKVIGFIAVVAIIALGFLGCEDLEGITGVKIETEQIGAIVGKKLTAIPEGTGTVKNYQWIKDGINLTGSDANNQTYTPKTAGEYAVSISDGEFKSAPVTVFAIPDGTYLMEGSVQSNWRPQGSPTGSVYDETVVISETKFRLDSTYDDEFIDFTIMRWEEINSPVADYPVGYRLLIANPTEKGGYYSGSPTYTLLYGVYKTGKTVQNALNGDVEKFLRTEPGTNTISKTGNNTINRYYLKQ